MPLTAPAPIADAIAIPARPDMAKPKITFTFKLEPGHSSNEYFLELDDALALWVLCHDVNFELALEIAAGNSADADRICHALELIRMALEDLGVDQQ